MTNDKALGLLKHIGNELKLLWLLMDAWQELFDAEREKRQALIRDTAPGFFAIVRVTLAESILMRISRLMDPPQNRSNQNASFGALLQVLSDQPRPALCCAIEKLVGEWSKKDQRTKVEQGEYARLKVLRNKWLAHNDWEQRSEQTHGSIWMPLSHDDFVVAQQLAGQLWALYRQCNRALLDTDVIEPRHEKLDDRPAMLLTHLCTSLYLDQFLDQEHRPHAGAWQAFASQHMGEDRIRPVFSRLQDGAL
ncbi:MAG: hypothetical protein AB7F83_00175 [Lysobacterales bacterium]